MRRFSNKPCLLMPVLLASLLFGGALPAQDTYQLTDQTPDSPQTGNQATVAPNTVEPGSGEPAISAQQPPLDEGRMLPSLFTNLIGPDPDVSNDPGVNIDPAAIAEPAIPPVVPASEKQSIVVEVRFLACDEQELPEMFGLVDPSQFELSAVVNSLAGNLLDDSSNPEPAGSQAISIRTQNGPAVTGIITGEQSGTLTSWFRGSINRTITQAPTVTMYDGQSAVVFDGAVRPFVVSVATTRDGMGNRSIQPVIQPIEEGSMLKVTAAIAGNQVQLSSTMVFNEIESVKEVTLHTTPAAGATVQVPVCDTRMIKFDASLGSDQWLLVDPGFARDTVRRPEPTAVQKLPVVGRLVSHELETVQQHMLLLIRAIPIPPENEGQAVPVNK